MSKKVEAAANAIRPADQWAPFSRLTVVIFARSAVFYGLNTFLPLYWIHSLQQSAAAGSSALTLMFTAGAVGTLFGGRLADRFGYTRIIRVGFTLLVPLLLLFPHVDRALALWMLIPIGLALFASFSPVVVLGQKYLPNRMGLASGITLGLAVSIGGVITPALGWFADKHGLLATLDLITYLPILAMIMAFTLPNPSQPAAVIKKLDRT